MQQLNLLDVNLLSDQVTKGSQRLGLSAGHSQLTQRLTHTQLVGLAQTQSSRHSGAGLINGTYQGDVVNIVRQNRPVS